MDYKSQEARNSSQIEALNLQCSNNLNDVSYGNEHKIFGDYNAFTSSAHSILKKDSKDFKDFNANQSALYGKENIYEYPVNLKNDSGCMHGLKIDHSVSHLQDKNKKTSKVDNSSKSKDSSSFELPRPNAEEGEELVKALETSSDAKNSSSSDMLFADKIEGHDETITTKDKIFKSKR